MKKTLSVAAAVEGIGEAFMQLAFSLRALEEAEDIAAAQGAEAEPEPKKARKPKAEPVKEPEVEESEIEESEVEEEDAPSKPDKIKLADLQEIGAKLIKEGNRSGFLAVLKKHKLKNLSSAPEAKYSTLWDELTAEAE